VQSRLGPALKDGVDPFHRRRNVLGRHRSLSASCRCAF
jgi:hypothetical protein